MMRTRAKQKHVASDRARRPNVPKHILFRYIGKGCIKIEKGGILIWNEICLHTKRSIRRW